MDERDARQTGDASERLDRLTREGVQGSRGPGFRGAKEWHEALQEVFENWSKPSMIRPNSTAGRWAACSSL